MSRRIVETYIYILARFPTSFFLLSFSKVSQVGWEIKQMVGVLKRGYKCS